MQGRAVAQDGRPITSAEVTITETSDPSLYFLAVVSDGSFRFDCLPPGTYKPPCPLEILRLRWAKSQPPSAWDLLLSPLKDKDLTGVILTLPEVSLPRSIETPHR